MDTLLVVNAGSSSVKFQVFALGKAKRLTRLIKGQMNGIGVRPRLSAETSDKRSLIDRDYSPESVPDVPGALHETGVWLREQPDLHVFAIGHRVVHGGPQYSTPVMLDEQVLAQLEKFAPLAPLHQPNNLAPIRSLLKNYPDIPQVACFDTAFHRTHSLIADHFALPEQYYAAGVRRYGFHGLSYEYVLHRLKQTAPEMADRRLIIAHLGSGASMCAVANGQSVEATMGFTALDGLPMGTRSGQIDPGVVLYLISERGMSPAQVERLLYHESGLKGLSGISNDVRVLLESTNPRATFAIDYFVNRIALYAGMLTAALGGLDGFVFTAGIGENSATMRTRIAEKLGWLGATLDPAANAAGCSLISRQGTHPNLYIVPTDEELMIARHTLAVLEAHGLARWAA